MSATKKILVPTDFSPTAQNAFQYALAMAEQLQAGLEVIHVVFPEYEAMDVPVLASRYTTEKVDAAQMAMASFVEHGLSQRKARYPEASTAAIGRMVEVGNPMGTIARKARELECDLIAMGTKGSHNALERRFGSVTTGVLEAAPCPVLVVPEAAEYQPARVVAYASDLSKEDIFHILEAGHMLAPYQPVLHVVHIDPGSKTTVDKVEQFAELEAFLNEKQQDQEVHFHYVQGDTISEGLQSFANMYEVDLLVMYAPHHNLFNRLFQQSQTKKMAMDGKAPLLVLKD